MTVVLNRPDAIAFSSAAFVALVGEKLCAADASGRPLPAMAECREGWPPQRRTTRTSGTASG
jgi:hypothetical protein